MIWQKPEQLFVVQPLNILDHYNVAVLIMNKFSFIAVRSVICLTSFCILIWILICFQIIPWPNASNGTPLITDILIFATFISFACCPICIIIKDALETKFHISTIIAIITILSYIPFFIQRRTFQSKICTCCDEYLIPQDIMDKLLFVAWLCTFVCFLIVGYYCFKKKGT